MGLTESKIQKLKKPGRYADFAGLSLLITQAGSKSWVFRIQWNGKRYERGIGAWPLTSVVIAREKALAFKKDIQSETKGKVPTFARMAEEVIELRKPTWKHPRQLHQWQRSFELYANPAFGDKLITEVTREDVFNLLASVWTAKPNVAQKLKVRVGAVLKLAIVKGHRLDNPMLSIDKSVLPDPTTLLGNYRAVPYQEIGAAIQKIQKSRAYPTVKLLIEFTILTCSRPSEARLMTWNEVDLENRLWVLPASRAKTKKDHRIPLSQRAVQILEEVRQYKRKQSDVVFPSAFGNFMSDMTAGKLMRENNVPGVLHATARSSFRDWCAESGVPREVAESALQHVLGKTERAYMRTDLYARRKPLMQAWSDYLQG